VKSLLWLVILGGIVAAVSTRRDAGADQPPAATNPALQEAPRGFGLGRGQQDDLRFIEDRNGFHFLLDKRAKIRRTTTRLPNGVETKVLRGVVRAGIIGAGKDEETSEGSFASKARARLGLHPTPVEIVTMEDLTRHWNQVFASKEDKALGWYEADVRQTLRFLDRIPGGPSGTAFLPGAGTSQLVDELASRGMALVLNDISDEALGRLKGRFGNGGEGLIWICHDISKPLPTSTPQVDLWADRAVLHFLLDEADIDGYFRNLRTVLKPGGQVLLAEFSEDGAPRCAGLNVHRYTVEEMTRRLGPEFTLVKAEAYVFTNPAGAPRPYIYALFRRG
jgi:SAM-dependent methyltransferase